MRIPLSWLKEYVDIPISVEELARRLSLFGLEVAQIEYIGLPGGELPWDADKVLVANILEVRQHPNADRLVLAEVDYGAEQPHTVVTGAPNLYQYKDQGRLTHPVKSVFAKEGAELYDGHVEGKVKVKLKGRPVRGIMSDAMLCSEKELGISEEHEGILILPDDAPIGVALRDYLGDAVLEIDVLPNMARALSVYGVAREVAALLGTTLQPAKTDLVATGPSILGRAQVTIQTPELCPRFTLTLIEGVQVGPSPFWMQRRLLMAGMRPINNIVDVTNYVMLELGQPSHAFDADKVADQHLIVRLAEAGERLTTLDSKELTLTAERLLVCDPNGPTSLAGVMGGLASEVSETTTRVLLEAAIWEPVTIRRTAQTYRLASEASRRFERSVDYNAPTLMQPRALSLMQLTAGGTIAADMIDNYPQPWQTVVLDLTASEVQRLLGIELTNSEIAVLLRPLGFVCRVLEHAVRVEVPSFRRDVTLLADLCEEVARMYGYDRLPLTLLADNLPEQRDNPALTLEHKVRDVLVGCGLDEAITYSLTSMPEVATVAPSEAQPEHYLQLVNPLTPEREYLRRSLLPTLLEALSVNLRERPRVLLFEVGRVYLPSKDQTLPDEVLRLGIAMAGQRDIFSWHSPQSSTMDFFDLKGVIEGVLSRLNISQLVSFAPLNDDSRFQPGRAATLLAPPADQVQAIATAAQRNKGRADILLQSVGVLGELHPEVRERLGIEAERALAAELDLSALIALAQPYRYQTISRYPSTIQDLALVVPLTVAADQVGTTIRKYAGTELEALTLFDVYVGPQIGVDKRSLAYRLSFRSANKTLTDEDLGKLRKKIIKGLEFEVGATIRG